MNLFPAVAKSIKYRGVAAHCLPKEYGSASAVHRQFQNRQRAGFFLKLWQAGLTEYDGMEGIAWEWQSIDGAIGDPMHGSEPHGPGKKWA
ncbi:MAG: hypothetical protein ACYCOU_23040 [Sulfobacillus sp.]|jgi:transposase